MVPSCAIGRSRTVEHERTRGLRPVPRWPLPLAGLRVDERHGGDGTVHLTLLGELDIATGEPLENRLRELRLTRTPAVLDLSGITFVDCSGLRVILDAIQAAARAGCQLEVSPDYSPPLRRLLQLAGADDLADPTAIRLR